MVRVAIAVEIVAAVIVAGTAQALAGAAAEDVLAAVVVEVAAADTVAVAAAISARAAGISRLPSMLRLKAVNLVAVTAAIRIADQKTVARAVILTIGVPTPHAPRLLRNRPKSRLCCRANRSRSIAGAPYPKLPLRLRLRSPSASNHRLSQKSRSRAFPVSPLP
jgi:hypothetical protein